MSYKNSYLRATSLADELVSIATDPELQQQRTRQRVSSSPQISTGLMSSTRRAFQDAADSFKVSGWYTTEEPYQEDPMDMLGSYIAGIDDPQTRDELKAAFDKYQEERKVSGTSPVPAVNFDDIRTGTTDFGFEMGPARPKVPEHMDTLMSIMDIAATATFGEGSRIVIKSGEGPHGSTRHRQGHAADIAVYRPDGSQVTAASKDARAFLTNAARAGILGIGAGEEYMGGSLFHLDIFPLERYAEEQGQRWNSLGSTIPTRFD